MKKPFLYLASQSPRRAEILRRLKVPFQIIPSDYEEIHPKNTKEKPSALVVRHAKGKALLAKVPFLKSTRKTLVLGADTIVYFRGRILGKPASYFTAEKLLKEMSGKIHSVYTGVALLDPGSGKVFSGYEKSEVRFHSWEREKIKRYVKDIHALDKAGAYAIQMKPCIVKSFTGSRTNIVGLPQELLLKLLKKAGTKSAGSFRSRLQTSP